MKMLLADTVREVMVGSSSFPLLGIALLLEDKIIPRSVPNVFNGLFFACIFCSLPI